MNDELMGRVRVERSRVRVNDEINQIADRLDDTAEQLAELSIELLQGALADADTSDARSRLERSVTPRPPCHDQSSGHLARIDGRVGFVRRLAVGGRGRLLNSQPRCGRARR